MTSPRGNETVLGRPIRVYDSGGSGDRYTVVFMNRADYGYGRDYIRQTGCDFYPCVGMSGAPFHPQGICQHTDCMLGKHLGKRIPFAQLPEDCRKAVLQDLKRRFEEMKYEVHIYAIVQVKVVDVEAESQQEAIRKAEARCDLYTLFQQNVREPHTEYAEDIDSFLVDEVGDEEHEHSCWYDKHANPSICT
jgi:hypothetical protein